MEIFQNDWAAYLDEELKQPYYQELRQFLIAEYRRGCVYPDMYDIFNALHYTPYGAVKVVILGQDPYHGAGQAHGLSFSVQPGVAPPPSLRNIFKELQTDVGCRIPNHGCLTPWAKQGVLLLNTVLTVRAHQANSHRGRGWETFTDTVIRALNEYGSHLVFLLWGSHAQKKAAWLDESRHLVLRAPHPSPLSAYRGFFGCKHFSQANAYLQAHGLEPIDWQV